jgi:hypothetical protein
LSDPDIEQRRTVTPPAAALQAVMRPTMCTDLCTAVSRSAFEHIVNEHGLCQEADGGPLGCSEPTVEDYCRSRLAPLCSVSLRAEHLADLVAQGFQVEGLGDHFHLLAQELVTVGCT